MRKLKQFFTMVLMVVLVAGILPIQSEAAQVKLSSKKITIYVGSSKKLSIQGTSKKVRWDSSDKEIAQVASNGRVTGKKAGTALVRAKVSGKTYKCKVTVKNPFLNKTAKTIKVGNSYTLKLTGTAAKSWKSSKSAVAAVNKKGKVTAKKDGTAIITCKGKDGRFYQCKVTVTHTHKYRKKVVNPTPEEDGYTLYTCTICKKSYKNQYIKYKLTEEQVYQAIISMKSKYPEGMTWTNDNFYRWKGGIYTGGFGCAGFAFLLSDAAFGNLPARTHYNFKNLRVGDILRMDNEWGGHSVVILSVGKDGAVVAEGNYNSSIHWGRKISFKEIQSTGAYVMTRYPEN